MWLRPGQLLELAENHAAGAGLQDTGDADANFFAQVGSALLDNNHCAVVEVANTLAFFFSWLHESHVDSFSR